MNNHTRAYLALAAICIIWGTTYTAIKYAVRDFPPFLLVGIRQTAAGLLLIGWSIAVGKWTWPGAVYVRRQALTGIFTITGGNGFITWGMQYVSSGLASIIGSLTPVVVVMINLFWQGTEKINARIVAGVLLGFGGLALVFHDGWADFAQSEYRWGIAGCFASCVTWSLGTVMAKRYNSHDVSPLVNAGFQILAGGLGGIVMSLLFDPTWKINHSTEGWISVVYLATIGSALAFTLYMFVLKHLSATVSSLYTYINPIIAILLGWLFLGELLNIWIAIGMAVTIVGVWLVNSGHRR
ncbi:MAG: EamA family transporter [Saprospiraceae bacterium]|nr:EamA family transporter [Saprospiraceae bacterium]